jgi:hypothetical protein
MIDRQNDNPCATSGNQIDIGMTSRDQSPFFRVFCV